MESACVRSALLGGRFRYLRAGDVAGARAAFEGPCYDATGENLSSRPGRLCARAKLGLSTGALA